MFLILLGFLVNTKTPIPSAAIVNADNNADGLCVAANNKAVVSIGRFSPPTIMSKTIVALIVRPLSTVTVWLLLAESFSHSTITSSPRVFYLNNEHKRLIII